MATSGELLAAREKGAEILHNGVPVVYLPRRPGDRKPWLARGDHSRVRYTAAQCTAYWPPADDECIDADGEPWPEHDYGEVECQRCGAEPES